MTLSPTSLSSSIPQLHKTAFDKTHDEDVTSIINLQDNVSPTPADPRDPTLRGPDSTLPGWSLLKGTGWHSTTFWAQPGPRGTCATWRPCLPVHSPQTPPRQPPRPRLWSHSAVWNTPFSGHPFHPKSPTAVVYVHALGLSCSIKVAQTFTKHDLDSKGAQQGTNA